MRRKSKVGVRWTPCRSSNGMLPRLIVLASSASFSFNRDHYSPGEHPPTCRFGRKCMERECIHATTFSSALDGALTYTSGCLTYLGHACLRLWMYVYVNVWFDTARLCVEKGRDSATRSTAVETSDPNERTSVHARFSLFSLSIQINSVCLTEEVNAVSRGKDDRGRPVANVPPWSSLWCSEKSEQ